MLNEIVVGTQVDFEDAKKLKQNLMATINVLDVLFDLVFRKANL